VPINIVCQELQSKWSVAAGPLFGYHQFKRSGTTTDELKAQYNYSKIRIKKEFVCAGFQASLLFKVTNLFSLYGEYSYSKSQMQKLANLGFGFRYFL